MSDSRSPRLGDDVLKAAYRLAHTLPAGAHLSEGQWEQLVCDDVNEAERDRLLGHVFACEACTEIHRSLLRVSAEAPAIDPGATPPMVAPPVSRTWMYLGTLAAAAVLVAAVLVDLTPVRVTNNTDVTRAQTGAGPITVVAPAEGAPLAQRRFTWQALPGADAYEVIVSTDDGGAVWSGRATGTFAVLPAEVTLARGRYYWRVTALRENTEIGRSRLIAFRVD